MTAQEFNDKYKDYIEDGFYGLEFDIPEMAEYLDKESEELIKLPGFKYRQIKSKFNWFCFYCSNVPVEKVTEIELKLEKLDS